MKTIIRSISRIIFLFFDIALRAGYKFIIMPLNKTMFASCGKRVYVGKGGKFHYKHIHIGNDVSIGQNATFFCAVAKIYIGNKIMFGPHVFMIAGSHRIDLIGRYMIDVEENEKLPENDKDIIIEDDVWIGANAIILRGVNVGRGSVVSAGSIVTKNVESYSIVAGVPAQKIKMRFTPEQIAEHERKLSQQ